MSGMRGAQDRSGVSGERRAGGPATGTSATIGAVVPGSAMDGTAATLARLQALASGLALRGPIQLVLGKTTSFAPASRRIEIDAALVAQDPDAGLGAAAHEVGHELITRYHLFQGPDHGLVRQLPAVSDPQASGPALSGLPALGSSTPGSRAPGLPTPGSPAHRPTPHRPTPHSLMPLWHVALNAAEDPRVHVFLLHRTPGVRPWLHALFRLSPSPDPGVIHSELDGFLMAMAGCDRGPLPFLPALPAAAAAFERTRTARNAYRHALPAADFSLAETAWEQYRTAVQPVLRADAPPLPRPPDAEVSARVSAAAALAIFRRDIWPVVLELVELDTDRIGQTLHDEAPLRARAEAVAPHSKEAARLAEDALALATHIADITAGSHAPRPLDPALRKLARVLLEARWQAAAAAQLPSRGGISTTRMRARPVSMMRDEDTDDDEDDEVIVSHSGGGADAAEAEDLSGQVAALERSLNRVLPTRQPSWAPGFPSGPRLDIPRAMLASATGRGLESIWQRRVAPKRVRLAVMLLVDCSGSMRGRKIAAATAATHLLASVLDRVRACDFSVYGFQDELIPVIGHGDGLTEGGKGRIEALVREVAGTNPAPWARNQPAYNDDGPVLREAAAILAARPATDRLLLVISDGGPSGRRSKPDDLHSAVAAVSAMPGMTLIGLGLGQAGTEAVATYYPRSEVNIEPGNLGATITRLLDVAFRRAARE